VDAKHKGSSKIQQYHSPLETGVAARGAYSIRYTPTVRKPTPLLMLIPLDVAQHSEMISPTIPI
jgi:hypothetical protein